MQLLWAALYMLVLIPLIKGGLWTQLIKQHRLLTAVLLMVSLSAFWSVDPQITARRGFGLIGSTLIGFFLASRFSVRDQLKITRSCLVVGGVLSLLTSVLLPTLGVMSEGDLRGAWCGVYAHKNGLGHAMILLILTSCVLWKSKADSGYKTAMWVAFASFLVLKSRSTSSIVLLIIAAVLIPLIRAFQKSRWHFLFGSASLVLLAGAYAIANLSKILDLLGKDLTLTGRLPLWIMAGAAITQKPWLGFGYGAFWQPENSIFALVSRKAGWHAVNAHNGFLQVVLDIGLIGLALVLCLLCTVIWRSLKEVRVNSSPLALWPVLYLCVFVVANMDEALLLVYNNVYWELFVTILVSTSLASSARMAVASASLRNAKGTQPIKPLKGSALA